MTRPRFILRCRYCRLTVATVDRIDGATLEALHAHILKCRPDAIVGPSPGVEAVLRQFQVTHTDPDDRA